MKHLDIKIFGKVQMVFFRHSAKQKADELGIKGYVRNEADGTVYIEAEATPRALKKFLRWCKKGPKGAKVEKIKIKKGQIKDFNNFEVLT